MLPLNKKKPFELQCNTISIKQSQQLYFLQAYQLSHIEWREILTYSEGDVIRVTCPDDEHLRAELDAMAESYGPPPPAAVGYDLDGNRIEYYDDRPEA